MYKSGHCRIWELWYVTRNNT